ncbi:MAG: histidine phosphatase family protein [Chloroflexi bacterium]|nr:histidine phosphatase family protein [Chloroflexota bacterium]
MQLLIIRHAQSFNNYIAEDLPYDEYMEKRSHEPPITELGQRQAQLLADHLAADDHPEVAYNQNGGYDITRLYCSPMLRTLQTALPISKALGLQPQVWIDIHEHGGIFQGNPRSEAGVTNFPGMTRQECLENFPGYTLPAEITEEGWWFGGYEELTGCNERALRAAQTLQQWAEETPDERIAIVSHGTFADALIKALFKQDFESQLGYYHYNTAITRIDWTHRGFMVLRYLNRTQHLPVELITK